MKVLRILLTGWTASFRYPIFISGFQPTLPVPPISTIYGLISAAKGDIVTPNDVDVGYVFSYESKNVDLETIYEVKLDSNQAKSNVVKREFLFNTKLYLYIKDISFLDYFKKPKYPLLLGRSSDLIGIEKIDIIDLEKDKNIPLGKTILPIDTKGAYGIIQALPTHFTKTMPRESLGTQPFILMNNFFEYEDECYYDDEFNWGVWFY